MYPKAVGDTLSVDIFCEIVFNFKRESKKKLGWGYCVLHESGAHFGGLGPVQRSDLEMTLWANESLNWRRTDVTGPSYFLPAESVLTM